MNAVITAALPVFALILTGWLAARWNLLGSGATDALNRYVVYLSLPALLFRAMTQVDLAAMTHWGYVGAFAGGIAITFVAGFASRRRGARALTDRSIEGLAAAYANAGYMGIPLCVALFGAESLAPAAFATLLTASVLFGCAIALIELDRQQAPGLGATLLKVGQALMRNPLLAAPVAGLAWAATGIALPEGLDRYVTLLGASASPVRWWPSACSWRRPRRPAPAPACCGWCWASCCCSRPPRRPWPSWCSTCRRCGPGPPC